MTDTPPPEKPRQDNARPAPAGQGPTPQLLGEDFVMGLRLFSRLPTGDHPFIRPDLSRIARALPFVSLTIAIGPAALVGLASWAGIPGLYAAALGVAVMIFISGGMAEDAIADAADGLFGGAFPERRLEIMKDSRHGTYGVAALCLYIVLRVAGIGGIGAANPAAAAALWLAAAIAARSGAMWLSLALPHARPDGISVAVGRVRRTDFIIGAVLAAILMLLLAGPFTSFLAVGLAIIAAALVALGWTALCKRLVGGQTGDLIGALQALIEIAVLTVFLAFA